MFRWSSIIFVVSGVIALLIAGLMYEGSKDAAVYASWGELWVPIAGFLIGGFARYIEDR